MKKLFQTQVFFSLLTGIGMMLAAGVACLLRSASPAFASGLTLPDHSIVAPHWSELSGFEPEFCGPGEAATPSGNGLAPKLCFGHMRFQGEIAVRAVVLVAPGGAREFYVENGLPGVELQALQFQVLGPVNQSGTPPGTGEVSLRIDAQGQVDGIVLRTSKYGTVTALAPNRGM